MTPCTLHLAPYTHTLHLTPYTLRVSPYTLQVGGSPYHYVELMACPSGCANGGGQPRIASKLPHEAAARVEHIERLMVSEAEAECRAPAANPQLAAIYAAGGFLEGGPLGETAQRHLTTQYHAVEASKQSALTIQW